MSDELNRREVERVVNNLVGEVDRLRRAQESSARAQPLRNAAIDGGDGLVVRDENGVDVYKVGVNPATGVVAPRYAPGPIPNQPSVPLVTAGAIASQVALNGLDVEENTAPEDFRHAEVHFSLEEGFEPSLLTLQGVVTEPRGTITVARPAGLWHVRVVWVTLSGQRSAPSDPVLVDIEPLVDTADIEQALATARAELAAATAEADAQFAELGQISEQARIDLDDARQRVASAEQALGSLDGEVDGLQSRLTTAEGNIAAAGQEATENLSALDAALRNAFADADAAVQSAAATDATDKANAARTAAETEALRLAQAEAAAAQSAAEATAAADALAKANAARDAAISSAAGDATTKAKAAEDAAKVAAAADAKAKADAAQAAAISAAAADAKTKADAAQAEALRLAKLDATAKADEAKSAAIQAAASDAQTKFDQAKALADAAQARADALAMAGDNLVLNGSGELGSLSGWPSPNLRLAPELAPVGTPNAIVTTIQTGFGVNSSERIVVDPSRTYLMSAKMYGKSGMYHYLAVSQYDVDGRTISYQTANRKKAADTTLAAPITRGDTTITLSGNGSQWNGSNLNSLGWWPYVTQAGIVFNRSDNYTQNLYRMNGFTVSGNTITLPSPWTGPDIPAGTEVGLMGDGGSFLYPASRIMGTDGWEDYSGRFGGGISEGNHGGEGRLFRPGVASIGVGFLLNNSTRVQGVSGFTATRLLDETAALAAETAQADADAAQAAADAAQARADSAHTAAGSAQSSADAAMTRAGAAETNAKAHADALPKVLRGTTAPAGTAPNGSVWWQHKTNVSGPIIGQWNRVGGQWVSTPIQSEAIANLDVGKLTAGVATVAQTVTEKLLANEAIINRLTSAVAWIGGTIIKDGEITAPKITVTNDLITKFFAANRALINEELVVRGKLIADHAAIISAALKNLSVAEKATFAQAFADEFWAKMAVIEKLTAQTAWIGGAMLKDGAVTAEKITATESLTAKVAQFLKVKAGMIEANAFEGQTFTGGTFTGSRFQSHTAANAGVKMDGTGLHAFNAAGGETFRVNGSNNLIVGEIATSTPGTPGLIVQAANTSTQKPALFFSADGTDSGTNAAIYADADWNLRLRGRDMGYGRSRIRVDGGLEVINGGGIMAGNQITGDMGGITGDGKGTFMGLEVASGFSYFYHPIRYPGAPTTTQPGNLWKSPSNDSVYVSTSRRAGKVNIETVPDALPDRLLDLDPRVWLDRTELGERLGERDDMIRETPDGPVVDVKVLDEALEDHPRRVPGLVAEEVRDVGLDDYVTYATDDDGVETVQGVAYDRLWTLLIPLVRRQREQIDALEGRLAALEDRLAAPEDRASARGRR